MHKKKESALRGRRPGPGTAGKRCDELRAIPRARKNRPRRGAALARHGPRPAPASAASFVSTGLPAALWAVVLIGAVLNGLLTYLFWIENFKLHALAVAILACFIALLIFLTAAMDNPFRGEFSVNSDVFQTILEKVMRASG